MRKILSVLLILFTNCVLFAADDAVSTIKKPSEIPAHIVEEAKEMVQGFQGGNKEKESVSMFDPNETGSEEHPEPGTASVHVKKPKAYYLISFSMPDKTIENIVSSAIRENEKSRGSVTVALKGFKNDSFKETIVHMARLAKVFNKNLPVTLLPDMFDKHAVKQVPFVTCCSGEGIIRGDVSVEAALEMFTDAPQNYGTAGKLYPVRERSIKAMVAAKQEQIRERFAEKADGLIKNIYVVSEFNGQFQKAKEDMSYHVDPEYILETDITDDSGNIIVKEGTQISPADYAPLGKYVIIDGRDDAQVKFALKQNPKKIIIMAGDIKELSKRYGVPFYRINKQIIAALHLEKVPAIIEQSGRYIRVTEKKL
jgi:type-F conjugative transfer system pilin assembly protein TrbC